MWFDAVRKSGEDAILPRLKKVIAISLSTVGCTATESVASEADARIANDVRNFCITPMLSGDSVATAITNAGIEEIAEQKAIAPALGPWRLRHPKLYVKLSFVPRQKLPLESCQFNAEGDDAIASGQRIVRQLTNELNLPLNRTSLVPLTGHTIETYGGYPGTELVVRYSAVGAPPRFDIAVRRWLR